MKKNIKEETRQYLAVVDKLSERDVDFLISTLKRISKKGTKEVARKVQFDLALALLVKNTELK